MTSKSVLLVLLGVLICTTTARKLVGSNGSFDDAKFIFDHLGGGGGGEGGGGGTGGGSGFGEGFGGGAQGGEGDFGGGGSGSGGGGLGGGFGFGAGYGGGIAQAAVEEFMV
ncbi:glycine-rich protein 5-like [Olea europaea var. sylvestris]|uniref:glycine-rich protein 5-like n=1 Tax=Olea europaea var. sylvestris TaxID=158386 RepID=UPI000C1D72D6|nr:glycine-rich protein 5-like [Olea europaea var. sylvestris]